MNHFKFQIHVIHIQYPFPFPFFLDKHSITRPTILPWTSSWTKLCGACSPRGFATGRWCAQDLLHSNRWRFRWIRLRICCSIFFSANTEKEKYLKKYKTMSGIGSCWDSEAVKEGYIGSVQRSSPSDLQEVPCWGFQPEWRICQSQLLRLWISWDQFGFNTMLPPPWSSWECYEVHRAEGWDGCRHLSGRLLSALASRMDRQKDDVDTRVVVRLGIQCDDKKSALDVCSVLQHSFVVDLDGRLVVSGDIEMEGWTALKDALSCGRLHDISRIDTICKRYTTSARREDLWAIWRCLSLSWYFSEDLVVFDKVKGEKRRWIALEEFLDTDYSLIPVTP